ncbi:HAMP domain-containing sensor histidine kinase [Paenibacillus agricola]|uniref:histidine kinase n=1 Tax=Paenibacillus agricola TaxID=2716264 RepID=A0ABX0J150_9BACL|nr:HAMP domain-containing sensor histidine kinase [Paenibacillus agricola]NHN28617.1 HAMP domain-containing histidine kinase [Paenibacillus agricola]
MFKNKGKKISILQYWTRRYLITLFIGLLLIGIVSISWVRHMSIQNRLQLLQVFTQDIADRVEVVNGRMLPDDKFPQMIENRKGFFQLEDGFKVDIVDRIGNTVFDIPGPPPAKAPPPPPSTDEPPPPRENSPAKSPPPRIPSTKLEDNTYIISTSVMNGPDIVGTVLLTTTKRSINQVNQEYKLVALVLSGFALLGWLVIYLISKKLSSPIRLVAEAAKQVKGGNYQIELPVDAKELEIDELFHSFKEMATRLNQLEDLRTEMLAGVTHELKTPLTSIRGLVYAVKDKIVTGEEADEFLDISIKETDRLQHMVNELLDFNSFVAGVISLNPEKLKMNILIREMVYQWSLIHQNDDLSLQVFLPDIQLEALGDTSRIQQIMINLLSNSKEAMGAAGSIEVTLYPVAPDRVAIDVKDSGCGIPPAEQSLVFERFYRGDDKKHKLRGLGLGLAFSSSLAKAMGGELRLKESSSNGTTFTLTLIKTAEKKA